MVQPTKPLECFGSRSRVALTLITLAPAVLWVLFVVVQAGCGGPAPIGRDRAANIAAQQNGSPLIGRVPPGYVEVSAWMPVGMLDDATRAGEFGQILLARSRVHDVALTEVSVGLWGISLRWLMRDSASATLEQLCTGLLAAPTAPELEQARLHALTRDAIARHTLPRRAEQLALRHFVDEAASDAHPAWSSWRVGIAHASGVQRDQIDAWQHALAEAERALGVPAPHAAACARLRDPSAATVQRAWSERPYAAVAWVSPIRFQPAELARLGVAEQSDASATDTVAVHQVAWPTGFLTTISGPELLGVARVHAWLRATVLFGSSGMDPDFSNASADGHALQRAEACRRDAAVLARDTPASLVVFESGGASLDDEADRRRRDGSLPEGATELIGDDDLLRLFEPLGVQADDSLAAGTGGLSETTGASGVVAGTVKFYIENQSLTPQVGVPAVVVAARACGLATRATYAGVVGRFSARTRVDLIHTLIDLGRCLAAQSTATATRSAGPRQLDFVRGVLPTGTTLVPLNADLVADDVSLRSIVVDLRRGGLSSDDDAAQDRTLGWAAQALRLGLIALDANLRLQHPTWQQQIRAFSNAPALAVTTPTTLVLPAGAIIVGEANAYALISHTFSPPELVAHAVAAVTGRTARAFVLLGTDGTAGGLVLVRAPSMDPGATMAWRDQLNAELARWRQRACDSGRASAQLQAQAPSELAVCGALEPVSMLFSGR